MISEDIALQRPVCQQIAQPLFAQPGEVVAWLGAVQAQDYLSALWAVGLRTPGATEQTIEQALAEKTIVRTWPMRGTIHFVAAADVRWMLELLAPRVVQRTRSRRAELGLDEQVIAKQCKGDRRRAARRQAAPTECDLRTVGTGEDCYGVLARLASSLRRLAHDQQSATARGRASSRPSPCSTNGCRMRSRCRTIRRLRRWPSAILPATHRRPCRILCGGRG